MKKSISVLLALLLCLNLAVAAFAADTCFVAGCAELCGSAWQTSDPNNAMTLKGNVYEKVYPNVPVGTYQFKVVYNGEWKDNGNDNVVFSVASACDVTITYDLTTGVLGYSGDGIGKTTLQVTDIYVAGAKTDSAPSWLNGENWNEKAASNRTTGSTQGIYKISYEDVPAGTYEFKFAADQAWTHSWGGTFTEFGVATDAPYNGGNISFTLTETAKVTLTLDLTNFDLATGGAKFTVSLNEEEPLPPPPVEENYYVAGCKELCGTEWIENTPANQMTKAADGSYTKTYKQVPKGTYQFKITDGTWVSSWGGDGPDGNYQFTTVETGDVTVKFVPGTKQISVDAKLSTDPKPTEPKATEPTPAPSGPQFYVAGNCEAMGNWNEKYAPCLMRHKKDDVYQLTLKKMPAGNYEFKVTDGTWNNSWGDNGGNYKFSLTETMNVIITFKYSNGQGAITVDFAPPTADLGMLPLVAAALCATMGACLLLMNKKKLI